MSKALFNSKPSSLFQSFAILAVVTAGLLLIPFFAMQYSDQVNWSLFDFVVMGLLIFAAGTSYILLSRKASKSRKLLIGAGVLLIFLIIWVELAVGIFH